jgi:hypothetical protein
MSLFHRIVKKLLDTTQMLSDSLAATNMGFALAGDDE